MTKLTQRLKPHSPSKGIICQLKETLPSPVTLHYRNKNDFHIRYDSSGRVVVGLCVGKASRQTLRCIKADNLFNTHPTHTDVARVVQEYIQHESKWKVCEHFQRGGNWRSVLVRSNHKFELMVIVTIHPQDLEEKEIRSEMERMKDYLLASPMRKQIVSVYYQASGHTRATAEQCPFKLLHGQSHIYERIGDYEFRISPESFFQINTEAARLLYDTVALQLAPQRMSTVVDLCCGTGTQGLMVARHSRGVIGVELSRSAVEDARFNAAHNQIQNAEFIAGRAEKLFKHIMEQLEVSPDIAVIVNPSRGGIDKRIISLLRNNERVRNLVYISCQADGPAMNNFVDLCIRGRKTLSEPFVLKKATPIDLFPHTNHCELVLSFRR
ncbi:tRNA (uracil(54)-C(5))-methyltransferase homolog isoform X2 [Daphnia pulicaria]|nr:tRNA (uracil(54)-C(5))-methyltransferase homolog isoform X2 [Daphnia pulicaria]XP_046640845.1 tRNA (uracil(54)-C(5))-methyltransferase homolog isoform X2 [Daphnia pulicaria]